MDYCVINMSKQATSFIQRLLLAGILLMASSSIHALGLGNIDVQSHLGEPLRATVKLAGIPKSLNAGCFKLLRSTDNHPSSTLNASILLREDGTGNANLLIKSYQAINDPIIQLTLVADCEDQIAREYLLLLDPPLFYEAATEEADPFAAVADIQPLAAGTSAYKQAQPSSNTEATSVTHSQTVPVKPSKPKKKPVAAARSEDGNAYPPSSSSAPKAPVGNAGPSQPRLVVSGGEYVRPDFFDSPLKLELSMDLNEWPGTDMQALSPEDVSDEVTAMANKLAYLESQMIALQKRNLELETARTEAAILRAEQAESSSWLSWLLYALVTLVVIALIGVAEWLRRRHSQRQLATEVAIWEELAPADKLQDIGLKNDLSMTFEPDPEQRKTVIAKPQPKASPVPQPAFNPLDNGHEGMGATVNEDILEQAEVFVAHGRASLAIVLLQDHLRDFPNLSPAPWLMLLDLLKRDNQADEYESATKECQRYFNVAAEDFSNPLLEDNSSIENYPRVTDQLVQVWGTTEALPFLDDLLYNRRLEARQGFERNAYLDILLLRSIASDLNFTGTLKVRAPVLPFKAKKAESDFEKTIVIVPVENEPALNIQVPEKSNPGDYFFGDSLEPSNLPKDKSAPLDFEIEFKTKK